MDVAIASISSGNNSCEEETGPHWAVLKTDEYDVLFGCDQATGALYPLGNTDYNYNGLSGSPLPRRLCLVQSAFQLARGGVNNAWRNISRKRIASQRHTTPVARRNRSRTGSARRQTSTAERGKSQTSGSKGTVIA